MIQKSKFHTVNVYLWIAFLLALVCATLYFIIRSMVLQTQFDSNLGVAFASLFILVAAGFALYKLSVLLKVVSITIDSVKIQGLFGKVAILQNNILEIDLFSRINISKYDSNRKTNGICITTKTGEKFYFVDSYYQNSPVLKEALFHNFISLVKNSVQYRRKNTSLFSIGKAERKKFSGNFFFSFNGALLFIPFVFLFFLFTGNSSRGFLMPIVICFLFLFIILSFKAYYFVILGDIFEVRNQIWFWKRDTYNIDKIKSIIIEKNYRQSNSLRINTTDFYTYSFQAGSLRDRTWQQLINVFESKGIEVYNEAFV